MEEKGEEGRGREEKGGRGGGGREKRGRGEREDKITDELAKPHHA